MSTQNVSGIEFAIVPEESRQHFRLLELPPDLLSVITAENPPVLQLKSQEGSPGHALDSNAVLCTPDKTYNLRQVSTSNEVYLAHASSNSNSLSLQPHLEAIAKCDSTLELLPTKNVSAVPHIKASLPIYTTTGYYGSKSSSSKAGLFASIPLSDSECEQAWQDLACFEMQGAEESRALIPSSAMTLKIWEGILTSATAESIDLTGNVDLTEISSIANKHDDWPTELIAAVVASMCSSTLGTDSSVQVDETKCARTVGQMLLQERTESGRSCTSLKPFTEAWANLLPENWRGRAEISLLGGSCILENGGQDVNFVEGSGTNGPSVSEGATAEANSTLGAKRKWHEKFRASKKTA